MPRMSIPRVAVIGAGRWGRNLLRNFAELGALAAVCDLDVEARKRASEDFSVPAEGDYLALLADPAIDAIVLATPAVTHAEMARTALEADKDVLVEKPLALRAERGREIVELAEARGRVLMVGHQLRYHPAVVRLASLLEAGELGALRFLSARRLGFGHFGHGARENVLHNLAPHDVSLMLHLLGERPIRVHVEGGAYLDAGVTDISVMHLLFEGGLRADLHHSWLHPLKEQRLVVAGDKAMAVFDDRADWPQKLAIYAHEVDWRGPGRPDARPVEPRFLSLEPAEPLHIECKHFIDCVRSRQTPITDGREGLEVLRVLEAAQRALDEGRPVDPDAPKPRAVDRDYFVHPSAAVDGPCEIGKGTKIWHFSKLLGPLELGEGCILGQNVVIERHVKIGNNVKIQNNVSVYSGVILEDDVFCGPSMVFTNVGTPRSHYPRKGQYLTTRVKQGASIGANATVVCGNTLGRYCFVGAGAVVTRAVPDYALVYGNPARLRGWACYCGLPLELGLGAEEEENASCAECARRYHRVGHVVEEVQP